MQSPTIVNKVQRTNIEKYGAPTWSGIHVKNRENMNKEYILAHFVTEDNMFDLNTMCEYFNILRETGRNLKEKLEIKIPNVYDHGKEQSKIHTMLSNYIECEQNNRKIIKPKELDIFIPSKNIAIEYSGLMWHSFRSCETGALNNASQESKHSQDHVNKIDTCEQHNIHLFHIFENEWLDENKQKIWKSMLLNSLGLSERIYARKCTIKEVPTPEKTKFLDANHIQGASGSTINLGLYYQEELVSLMTFGKPRFNKNYEWELIRFCNKLNLSIVGGASRLLSSFIKYNAPKSIISYANRRWSQGNLYEKLGFKKIRKTEPNYFYFHRKENILYNRMKFQKCKLSQKLSKFDPSLSETQNMYNNGYRKIYDCGNLVYGYTP